MRYRNSTYAEGAFDDYLFEKNLQGDIIAIYNESGTKVVTYNYNAFGKVYMSGNTTIGTMNPFTYRGYYYDHELQLYYLQSRYYDPEACRFINADGQINSGLLGCNLYAYCDNNPVMRVDYTGHAWWHWALAATVVVACAVATVVTCGGFAAAATAVTLVASGTVAATAASTVAATAFIASSTALGAAAFDAAINSSSLDEFAERGNWGTVLYTITSAIYGGLTGYQNYQANTPKSNIESNASRRAPNTNNISFSKKAQQHMEDPNRRVPINIQVDAIKYGVETNDPGGSKAMQYTIEMYRNNVPYKLHVIYDWEKNMIYHFDYKH